MKSDKSLHNICIAAIKRSTMKPYDFKWSRFYETKKEYEQVYQSIPIALIEDERIFCSVIIDEINYSILTTRRLFTKENDILKVAEMSLALDKLYGDFKGYEKKEWTFGKIELPNEEEMKYFVEIGKASMIMIYGVRTLIGMNNLTQKDIDNTIKRWTNRKLIQ